MQQGPTWKIEGNIVDIPRRQIYPGFLEVKNGKIHRIEALPSAAVNGRQLPFLLPGFTDAHVHIESSLLIPSEFARLAVLHGTVGSISDPHEIANVCGIEGVHFMIENGLQVPFKFNFGAPSCVPATRFETAGATLNADAVKALLDNPEVRYLSEMMNFPGVLNKDPEVMEKISVAKQLGKPIDGHAPGLRGAEARQYIAAGISTDHECFTAEEALDKLQAGMKILIREGSAARNFDALIDLLQDFPDQMMFCSDDKHPDSLLEGHINQLCARAAARGIDLFHVLQAACINPVVHYNAPIGLLNVGDPADFIAVKDLKHFEVLSCYINGRLVASEGKSLIAPVKAGAINHFDCSLKKPVDFRVPATGTTIQPVIEALDGQLITLRTEMEMTATNAELLANPAEDMLKLVVVNRYQDASVAKAFVKNFGIKNGALASSVAHDSHNIIAVGSNDDALCRAVNLVIENRGGLSLADDKGELVLPLPIAGLMSDEDGFSVAQTYIELDARAKAMGSPLRAPFMTLSFMALLVIPHLKLSDLGLFDGDRFAFL